MSASLKVLETANRSELIKAWSAALGAMPPPSTSQDMMRLIVGWELQAKNSRANVRSLRSAVKKLLSSNVEQAASLMNPKTTLSQGTRLSREWQGRTYSVDVLDKGYAYDGRLYTSLTPIAKSITGSHRSGPLFFGVSQ